MINWQTLHTDKQLEALLEQSHSRPQVIFKHSIRCAVSSVVKSRLERSAPPEGVDFHYLDLINYRQLSDRVASDLHVYHESPQVLIIKNGACTYDESHYGITMDDIAAESSAA